MRRIVTSLLVLTLCFAFPIKVWPQTAYAYLEDGVLTFKYGDRPNSGSDWVIPEHSYSPIGWYGKDIYEVEFDPSFAVVRPTACNSWFQNCSGLWRITGLQYLNTSQVTTMAHMFDNCPLLTEIDLLPLDTRNVTDMSYMFRGCSKLKRLDFSQFMTGNLTNMEQMFSNCKKLYSLDLSSVYTGKVTTMEGLFDGCSAIKRIDLHNMNTSQLSSTKDMFKNCEKLERIICDGDWSGVSESTDMFYGCTNLVGAIPYNSGNNTAAYANKTTGYFSPFYYYIAEISNDLYTLTFRSSSTAPNGTTQWDVSKSGFEEIDTNPNPDNDDYEPNYTFHGCESIRKVVFDESFKDARPNSCYSWFNYCFNLKEIEGIENLNTSEVLNMKKMFYGCNNLIILDLRSFDMSNVNSIGQMFLGCSNLETIVCDDDWKTYPNIGGWSNMFIGCTKLKGYNSNKTDINYANPTYGYFTSTIDYKVDVTIPSYNICTYSSTYDLDFTNIEGLTAYVISAFNASEGTLTLSPATTVKAGEGLLLKGNAGEYVVPRTTTDVTYTNYLVGVPTTTSISPTDGDYTNFVLANGTHGVNFYALSKTGNISAGKAYLKLPTADINKSNLSRGFVIDDNGTTSISTPIRNEYDDMLYDLQGRRVNKPSKGLYIMNGKKVIIK